MPKKQAFTLIELLVVISIISLLIAILIPSLAKARETAKTVKCASNLRQIGMVEAIYSDTYDDYLVPGNGTLAFGTWTQIVAKEGGLDENEYWTGIFECPANTDINFNSSPRVLHSYKKGFALSGQLNSGQRPLKRSQLTNPGNIISTAESMRGVAFSTGFGWSGMNYSFNWHLDGQNFGMVDAGVRYFSDPFLSTPNGSRSADGTTVTTDYWFRDTDRFALVPWPG